jgi:hypothetical protein
MQSWQTTWPTRSGKARVLGSSLHRSCRFCCLVWSNCYRSVAIPCIGVLSGPAKGAYKQHRIFCCSHTQQTPGGPCSGGCGEPEQLHVSLMGEILMTRLH